MKLIVEPEGGIGPILAAIAQAKTAIDIVIFRLDCRSVTRGLEAAVRRGVVVRAIIRDGQRAFIGSQSLGPIELDRRREVGVIVRDQAIVRRMQAIFEHDWLQTHGGRGGPK